MFSAYQTLLQRMPLRTNMATATVVMFSADAYAQHIEATRVDDAGSFDGVRSTVMTSWNALIFTPTFFVWFRRLERTWPGTSPRAVVTKVMTNQIAMNAPITALALAYAVSLEAGLRAMLGQQRWQTEHVRAEVGRRWSESLGVALLASACLWVPVNLLNFSLVPPHLRVVPTILTSCAWNTYLSLKAHEDDRAEGDAALGIAKST